jgi:pimeloyl-ACP methyl ester carboxylesterase
MSDFAAQWKQPTHVTADTDDLAVFDIEPSQEKTCRPVLLVPGWGGTPEMYRMNAALLVELGRRTLVINAPHGIDHVPPGAIGNELPEAQARRVAALLFVLESKQIRQIDAIGHSEGCLDLVFTAGLVPTLFRNLVLIESPGLFGRDTWWRLVGRFLADAIRSSFDCISQPPLRQLLFLATRQIASSLVRSPVRAVREIASIAGSQIRMRLRRLTKAGISLAVIHGVDDGTFPMQRVQELVDADMVDGFFSVKGRHGQFQLDPTKYTKLADYALTAMDAKRQRPTPGTD